MADTEIPKKRKKRCFSCAFFEPDSGLAYARSHCTNAEAIKNWPQTRLDDTTPETMRVRQSDGCRFWASRRGKATRLRTKDSAICPMLKVALRLEPGSVVFTPCQKKADSCQYLAGPIFVDFRAREVSIRCYYPEEGTKCQGQEDRA